MSTPYDHLHWWLSGHPTITTFQWSPSQTPFSSLPSLIISILLYLSLTLLLHLLPIPSPSPSLLHLFSSLHNLILLLLSFTMSLGCSLSSLSLPSRHLFCFPPSSTLPQGPLFFWSYIFYLSKLYEFIDTLLILLSGGRRLTFLHVYHHAGVVLMSYLWLATKQSLMPIALVTNASVHVVMYSYYLCSSLGWRWPPRLKRMVTEVQILQFVVSFGMSLVFLWFHFFDGGCEGMQGWLFNALFNASLLLLFLDFHGKAYGSFKKRDKMIMMTKKTE
ncbi:elongation of fatty acids protein 3-like [Dioscorea cayenensis subsp. rotundata]|uniref:very-long-chain 3-oxoacyl-CoA synthase n=1 Tax=Dioscorea cayennensis subsp. rotundata TaxID=55577 RepID=A0AB40AIP3_DIOCR|nr:elongation of fatty acids protein 3-like [Dioscorea cayenensis subsp. rotundata]